MVVLCCIVVVTGFLPFPVSRSSLSSPPSQVIILIILIILLLLLLLIIIMVYVCKSYTVLHKFSFHLQPRIHCFTLLLKHGPLRRGFGYPPPYIPEKWVRMKVLSQKPSTARSTRNGAHPTQS